MKNKIHFQDKFFVGGSQGMVGSAICRSLLEKGYGKKENGGLLLKPNRSELNLLN